MNQSSGASSSGSQQPRKTHNQNIQAYVRVRPLNVREQCIRSIEVVDVISPREIMTRSMIDSKLTKKFTYDRTFGPESRQVEVYRTVVAPLIDEVLAGYNCTVFAYGQTGTGKTHTMVGTECAQLKSSWDDDSDIGIIPRALCHLFDELRMMEMEFSMRISYLELYNEELCDLLSTDDNNKIRIFDDSTKKGSVIIQGLEEIPVQSKDDVYKLLEKGKERRKTASTLMNAQSSRSHTVFSILVHIRENGIDGEEMLKIGKLNLVDLAGSENVSKAGNEKGIRVRETVNINQSLLTLGRVITALVERTPHVPYRESKLTRLLQESLGGRTKTSIIATISPGHKDIEETLSTLEYAHRAKNIQNKPEVNQKLTKKIVLKEYTEEIDKLKRDLIAARDKNGIYLPEEAFMEMNMKMDSQNRELNEKMLLLKALKDELQSKERIFNEVSLNLVHKTEELKVKDQSLLRAKGQLFVAKRALNNTKRRYYEKKVLIDSHVKTEKELTTQAAQVLEVADTATRDTKELHDNIERRKDIDQKIQTASQRFNARMHESFDIMDQCLNQFNEKQNSFIKLMQDDFTNSATVQDKLLTATSEKITTVNDLINASLSQFDSITEQYSQLMCNLNEKKCSLEEKMLINGIKHNILQPLIETVRENLLDMHELKEQQKYMIDKLRSSVLQALERNFKAVQDHTAEMHKQIEGSIQIAESNQEKLTLMNQLIEEDNSLITEEKKAMDELVNKMQKIIHRRLASCDAMRTYNSEMKLDTTILMGQLHDHQKQLQLCESRAMEGNGLIDSDVEAKVSNIVKKMDADYDTMVTKEGKSENLVLETIKNINTLHNNASEWSATMKRKSEAHQSEVKRFCNDAKTRIAANCTSIKQNLADDCQRLNSNVTVCSQYCQSMESTMQEFTQLHQNNLTNLSNDVNEFQQMDLKTYQPTGKTPSKRSYVYPRTFATTSPHNRIIERLRKENDWSETDTTIIIDENSLPDVDFDEIEIISIDHEALRRDEMLNSTPLNEIPPPHERNRNSNTHNCVNGGKGSGVGVGVDGVGVNGGGGDSAVNKLNVSPRRNSTMGLTPQKTRRTSKSAPTTPTSSKINKENCI